MEVERPQGDDELVGLVQGYIADVRDGRRVVGKRERQAVERHLRDLELVRTGERSDLRFDEERALHILQFAVRYVRHTKPKEWAGLRYRFCERSAWIAFVLWSLFGWVRRSESGAWIRRFDEAYLSVARKNGKTMIAAIVALYLFCAEGEVSPEVYFAATERHQAAICWKQAAAIVGRDKWLKQKIEVKGGAGRDDGRMLLLGDFEALAVPLSRNDDKFDGFSPYGIVLDEVHAHPDSGMYDVLRSGTGARTEPLILMLTTAGADPNSFCRAYEKNAELVLSGAIENDTQFVFIARMDEGDDYHDEQSLKKSNPNWGVSVRPDRVRSALQKAVADPSKLAEYLRKQCNLWIAGEQRWLTEELWEACREDFDIQSFRGEAIATGTDLSKTTDLTSSVAACRRGDLVYVWQRSWMPEETLRHRAESGRAPVELWRQQGHLVQIPGPIIDQDFVKQYLLEQAINYDVRRMAFDPAQSWKLCGELQAEGYPALHFPQSWPSMHGAVKETEDLIRLKKLRHNGDPVLAWAMLNASVRTNSTGLRRLDKERSQDSIDPAVALVMAVARVLVEPVAEVFTWNIA